MAGGNWQDENEEITGINVTPLVDVMLVLLIIFMVTTSYIVTNAIDLSLPSAETGQVQGDESNELNFELNRDGQLILNGSAISLDAVGEHIEQAKAAHSHTAANLQAQISADKSLPHGQVMNLIDIVRKHGINNFAITVEAPQAPQ